MNGNGVYTAVKTRDGVATIFIEEEVLELGRLNRKTEQHRAESARLEADADRADKEKKHRQAKAAERRQRATVRLIKQELKVLAASVIVVLSMKAGVVAAAFAIPVLVVCQTVICFRAGRYFGKYPTRWIK